MLSEGPADWNHDGARYFFGQPDHAIAFFAEGTVKCGEGRAESDRTTSEQDILRAGIERLELILAPPREARDEEQDRRLCEMFGQIEGRPHIAHQVVGEVFLLPPLDRRPDISLEDREISFCDPAPLFGIIDGDEDPGLSISA